MTALGIDVNGVRKQLKVGPDLDEDFADVPFFIDE
jgi:hypothetical protein